MANPMLQIGDALINVQNVSLITLNANKSGEVIKFDDLDKAKAVFNKIAIRTATQLIEGD